MSEDDRREKERTVRFIEIGYRTRPGFQPVLCMLPSRSGPVADLFFAKLQLHFMQWRGEHPERLYVYRHVAVTSRVTPVGAALAAKGRRRHGAMKRIDEDAVVANVSVETLRKAIKDGRLPTAGRIGNSILLDREQVEAWVKRREEEQKR